MIFFLGAVHKLRHPLRGDLPKGSNMGDKGEGGVKNLKKWGTSFVDSPLGQLRKDAPHLSFGFW